MEHNNLDKVWETLNNNQDLDECKHEWDFLITPMKDSNLFFEVCKKCLKGIKTLELFEE